MAKRFRFKKGCNRHIFPVFTGLRVDNYEYFLQEILKIRKIVGYSKNSRAKYLLTIKEGGGATAEIIIERV